MTVFQQPRRLALIALPALALGACSHGPKPVVGEPAPAMVQSISNADQIGDVIATLGRGDAKAATRKLDGMIKHNPDDARSRLLLQTITEDPVATLGSTSFAYAVRRGETLRDLAQRFLGNGDKFYLLARYNSIAVPDAVEPGQTIRIPGTAPAASAPPPRAQQRPAPHAPEPVARPTPKPAAPARPTADPARAAHLRSAGLAALAQGKVNNAVVYLHNAAVLDPGNALIQRDLARAVRIQRTVNARK